ncbi:MULTISPECIES: ComEC/Rec2 family competence protein [unclassified Brevundimonas]|uniref:ComEC/Rec2 family competence protein n=1 Tax=unclassified Brevundimonas TaxID=2622653 RepID=UPI0006F6D48C|nr:MULTISPECIES: ComEC/Rec2 family competence protein [unclassified Brevundimonas]KQY95695.1 competence protein ComEC [Brevundimonas sp. Root1423]KRA29384.1 competence protein ComEC [Brevundimonas sp. Root608]
MAGVIAPTPAKPSLAARGRTLLSDQFRAQTLRWRMWAPVAFGGGCAVYFALKSEPPAWPLLLAALIAAALWLGARRLALGRVWTLPLLMLACFALGFAVAKLRTDAVAAPIAPAMAEPTVVEGWVVDVDSPGSAGPRVVIAPVRIRGLTPEQTPVRLRATVRGETPAPGQAVRLFAILNPPPAPASPGAYDFGRNAFFQSLGGVAFSLGETRPAYLTPPPWRVRAAMAVNGMRFALARRIVARLGDRTGGIAAAMTTGQEAWLNPDDVDVMRDSGLAHILSISGLHMAVVGGFAFFLVRLLVAAWPWLALRVPGKKVAAIGGLLAVGTYLVVSGAPPPAERAAITASIAFLAILLDRQAITMHALAVAAFVVLLLQPEAIVTPGFQMSFAATAALVALVEAWPRRPKEISAPLPILIVQRAGAWLAAAVLASLVAGAATGPFAMQHFNRTAMYGLASNLATAPVSDFLIMPMLALGALLEPLGLGGPFLWLAGQGIGLMLAIGAWTAGLPGAVRTVASAPDLVLPISFLGVLFCCLWRGPLRWLGLPFAAAVMLWPRAPTPDVWIGDGGTNAAWVQAGQTMVMRPGVRQFAVDVWSRRRGLLPQERPSEGWTCTRFACAPEAPAAGPLALWWGKKAPSPEQIDALCRAAPVVSARAALTALPPSCDGRLVLDGVDYARGGAVELWRDGPPSAGRWRAVWAAAMRGDRPWSRFGDPDVSDSGG